MTLDRREFFKALGVLALAACTNPFDLAETAAKKACALRDFDDFFKECYAPVIARQFEQRIIFSGPTQRRKVSGGTVAEIPVEWA